MTYPQNFLIVKVVHFPETLEKHERAQGLMTNKPLFYKT